MSLYYHSCKLRVQPSYHMPVVQVMEFVISALDSHLIYLLVAS